MNWDKQAYLHASKYRAKIYELLKEKPRTPKELVKLTGIKFAHVSRCLRELQDKNLIVCLTSKDIRKNKVYGIVDS